MKMLFFSPPQILLQGKSGREVSPGEYICTYKKKQECSLNLTLSGGLK